MCLGIPGKIISITGQDATRRGMIDYAGVVKEASLACVPDAAVGNYVIVHAGLAITVLDEDEAQRSLQTLRELFAADKSDHTTH